MTDIDDKRMETVYYKCYLMTLHPNWIMREMRLTYIGQKKGHCCGSGCQNSPDCCRKKVYVPVSCSKKCPDCNGNSPGCGKNFGFNDIKNNIIITKEIWDIITRESLECEPKYRKCVKVEIAHCNPFRLVVIPNSNPIPFDCDHENGFDSIHVPLVSNVHKISSI